MTLTDDQIRLALDARLRAANLDDDGALPEPNLLRLPRTAARRHPSPAGRRRLIAAAIVGVVGAGATVATNRGDDGRRTTTTPAASTSASSTPTTEPRIELPPPWPKLEVHPPTTSPPGPPGETEEQFLERLPDIDAQDRAQIAATGRINILDQLTAEVVSVDQQAWIQQMNEAFQWYRDHILPVVGGGAGDASVDHVEMDPVVLFTDGSVRLVYRSDLDCTPRANGTTGWWCLDPNDDSTPDD